MFCERDHIEYDSGYKVCCTQCEQHEMKHDQAADYVKEIVSQLYSTQTLDQGKLENALDELCWLVGVKPLENELQVQRTRSFSASLLQMFPHLKTKLV